MENRTKEIFFIKLVQPNLLHRDGIVEIGRSSVNSIHATHYLKFTVKITTNQLHFHFRNKVPFMKKKVSPLLIEYF